MLRTTLTAAAASALLFGATMAPAEAANNNTTQDGLVNVNVGDVTIEDAVDIAAAVEAVANVCDVADVGPVAAGVLGKAIATDKSGRDMTVCTAQGAPVTITQN